MAVSTAGEEWLAKGFMLLLFGIPVFVWMKWRQKQEPVPTAPDPDAVFLLRAYTPPPKPPLPAPHHDIERTPVGLGID